jgi:hypothetical protein
LHFNPKHALSEQLVWDSEHAPQNVGLSHNVLAQIVRKGDDTVVEAITKVQSIDLVADPATTAGLFEQVESKIADIERDCGTPGFRWDQLTVEHLQLHRPDLLAELKQGRDRELVRLRSEVDELAVREAAIERRRRIAELFAEHGLPLPGAVGGTARQIVSEQFMQTLMTAADDKSLQRLVKERAELVRAAGNWLLEADRGDRRPRSRDQALVRTGTQRNGCGADEFVAAIRGR